MSVIYEPKGRAREYAALAANLYSTCPHACSYCYCPSILKKKPEDFHISAIPRKDILKSIRREAPRYNGDEREIHLCFIGDPYVPEEAELRITRQVLEIFLENNCRVEILTKAGALVQRDFDLMKELDVRFGQTLIFFDDCFREKFEPGAASISERIKNIKKAKELGIRTWISAEPVINPFQIFKLIEELKDYVDKWFIGKINYNKILENAVNWKKFYYDAREMLEKYNCNYKFKNSIMKFIEE